jgi:drug/metabolite transporter (DMT)-like permease
MRRWTRALAALAITTPVVPLLVISAVSSTPAAQAATVYPGGPEQTPVMGWSGWSFLRLGRQRAGEG